MRLRFERGQARGRRAHALLRIENNENRQSEREHPAAAQADDRPGRVVVVIDRKDVDRRRLEHVSNLVDGRVQRGRIRPRHDAVVGELAEARPHQKRDPDHDRREDERKDVREGERGECDTAESQRKPDGVDEQRDGIAGQLRRRQARLQMLRLQQVPQELVVEPPRDGSVEPVDAAAADVRSRGRGRDSTRTDRTR